MAERPRLAATRRAARCVLTMSWVEIMRELERERFDVSYLRHAQRARKAETADTPTKVKLRRIAAEKRDQ